AGAAVRAEDLDLVALFGEMEVGVRQLAPPEADRPPRGGGDGRVGDDDGDALGPRRVDGVQVLVTHGYSIPANRTGRGTAGFLTRRPPLWARPFPHQSGQAWAGRATKNRKNGR